MGSMSRDCSRLRTWLPTVTRRIEFTGNCKLAITLEGKGGFDFEPEHRNKDFYTTLESYMTAAVKGLPIVEHTMSSITVHGTTDYIVHYPIILVAPATRDAILGPKPYITHDIQYSVFRTGAKGCDKVTRHCKVSICASTNIWEVPQFSRATVDPTLPPDAPPPGIVAKCWVQETRRCRVAARPLRLSAASELYADLGNTVHALNGQGAYTSRVIGDPPLSILHSPFSKIPHPIHPTSSYILPPARAGEPQTLPPPTSGCRDTASPCG